MSQANSILCHEQFVELARVRTHLIQLGHAKKTAINLRGKTCLDIDIFQITFAGLFTERSLNCIDISTHAIAKSANIHTMHN